MKVWRRACIAFALVFIVFAGGMSPLALAAGNLTGEGESWPFPGIQALLIGGTKSIAPYFPVYVDVGEASAKSDAASGAADFAVCSSPLLAADHATARSHHRAFKYVPFMGGAVALVVALDIDANHGGGRVTHLTLTIPTLAKLFTRGITSWNSPEVLNENLDEPTHTDLQNLSQPQVVAVTRGDSSSSTDALISLFLSDPDARKIWNAYATGLGVPADTPVDQWPLDPGTQTRPIITGSKGIIDTILGLDPITGQRYPSATSHHISYLAPSWAIQYGAPMVTLASKDLTTKIDPSPAAVAKSLADATFDPKTNLVKMKYGIGTDGAYPVSMVSYMAVPTTGLDSGRAKALSNLVRFALSAAGQGIVSNKNYVGVTPAMKQGGLAVATALIPTGSTSLPATHHPSGGSSGRGSETTVQGETIGAASAGGLPRTGGGPWLPLAAVGTVLLACGEIARRRLLRRSS